MSLITLGLALDYKTEAGLDATSALDVDNRPFFWQQMERTRANFAVLNDLTQLRTATITLTDAQTKALPTTPIAFIASPGVSGKHIVIVKGSWKATTTSGAYTNINGTLAKLRLVYGANVTNASYEVADIGSPTEFTGLLGTAGVKVTFMHNWKEIPENFSNIDNAAVQISIDNNGSGNLTGGHASNSLVVTANLSGARMTPTQYWTRWALAGALFLTAQYLTVTRPLLTALRPVALPVSDTLTPLRTLVDCQSIGYATPHLKASEVMR